MMSWIRSPTVAQAWTLLVVAGVLEVAWAIGMKSTDGFTRTGPTALVTGVLIASFALLGLAMKALPAGTAYAVWVGIGATGTAALGMWIYGEPATATRLICLGLIVAGVIGLKLLQD